MSIRDDMGRQDDAVVYYSPGTSSAAGSSAIPIASPEHVKWHSDSMKWEAGPAAVQTDTIIANVVRVKELQDEHGKKIVVLDEGLVRRLLEHVKDLQKEVEVLKLTKSDKRKPKAKPKTKPKKIEETPYPWVLSDEYIAGPVEKTWKDWSSSVGKEHSFEILKRIKELEMIKPEYKDAY